MNISRPKITSTLEFDSRLAYLLPSDRGLAVAETHLQGGFAKEFVLKRILEQVQGFDICLIDCQPQCNTITKNALVAADAVLIPTQGKVFSVGRTLDFCCPGAAGALEYER